ncbi:MAG: hypothetical protein L0G59_01855 [Kocuria sp.]|nr:hypothetical protein [Kocuria sp.]
METVNKNTLSRRTLTKGALWSAPVLAASSTVPSYAVSDEHAPMEVSGFVRLSKECNTGRPSVLTLDGTGMYPIRGFWIMEAEPSTVAVNAKLTYYFPNSIKQVNWTAQKNNGEWTTPQIDVTAPPKENFIAFSTTYYGEWDYDDEDAVLRAITGPSFWGTFTSPICPSSITTYALRTVTADGITITEERGPNQL